MQSQERGIRTPLMLIACAYGFVQFGVAGGLLGLAAGFVVGTFATTMVSGIALVSTGFLALWLQAGGGERIVSWVEGRMPVTVDAVVALDGVVPAAPEFLRPLPPSGTLAGALDPGETAWVACVRNDLTHRVDFEYRWGESGPWVKAALPPGGAGLAASASVGRFEARWPRRAGSGSLADRWIEAVRATGTSGVEACPPRAGLGFRADDGVVELVRTDGVPRAMVCVINRSDVDVTYRFAWTGDRWSTATIRAGHRRWFDSDAGRTFSIRLPDWIGGTPGDAGIRTLEHREVLGGGDCGDGAVYVLERNGDAFTVAPAG